MLHSQCLELAHAHEEVLLVRPLDLLDEAPLRLVSRELTDALERSLLLLFYLFRLAAARLDLFRALLDSLCLSIDVELPLVEELLLLDEPLLSSLRFLLALLELAAGFGDDLRRRVFRFLGNLLCFFLCLEQLALDLELHRTALPEGNEPAEEVAEHDASDTGTDREAHH